MAAYHQAGGLETDPLLSLLSDLVAIDSVNDPGQDRRPSRDCAEFIGGALKERGIPSDIMESEGFYTVRGTIGKEDPQVLLMSHYDVVPPGPTSRWKHPPLTLSVEGGKAYGRGVVDDKGNVTAIITALQDIADRVDGGVGFAITGDEEMGGQHGAKLLAQEWRPHFVVNGDGIDLQIINRRRNYFLVQIQVPAVSRRTRGEKEAVRFPTITRGRETRHSAYFIPGVDSHSLLAGAYHILRWDLTAAGLRGEFVKENVIPDEVEVEFVRERRMGENVVVDDNLTRLLKALIPLSRISFPTDLSVYGINALPNYYWKDGEGHHVTLDVRAMAVDPDEIRQPVERVLQELLPEATLGINAGAGCLMTDPGSSLVRAAKEVASNLGIPPRVTERQGSSDSRYFSSRGVECIDFGPQGGNLHGPDEYVVISTLERAEKFYAQLVTRLLGTA